MPVYQHSASLKLGEFTSVARMMDFYYLLSSMERKSAMVNGLNQLVYDLLSMANSKLIVNRRQCLNYSYFKDLAGFVRAAFIV